VNKSFPHWALNYSDNILKADISETIL